MKKYTILVAALVLLFLAYKFLLNTDNEATSTANTSADATEGERPRIVDGADFAISDYAGKVVILDFWASWCGPCKRQIPVLDRFYESLKSHDCLEVIAINLGESQNKVERFLARYPMPYDVMLDQSRALGNKYGIRAIPTLIVFNASGKIIDRMQGFNPNLDSHLRSLLRDLIPDCISS
ncbi:MAG: TlpA disulfide reductase family protein [Candidatus Zixiibacteriota bacterium]